MELVPGVVYRCSFSESFCWLRVTCPAGAQYHLVQQTIVGAEYYSGYKAALYPFVRTVLESLCLETLTLLNSSDFN